MNEQNKSDSSLINFPGAAVVALLVGIFVLKDIALESFRPSMTDTGRISSEDVRSRLWQDPFEAVATHRKKYAEQTGQTVLSIVENKDQREFRISHARSEATVTELDEYEAIQSGNPLQIICNSAKNGNGNGDDPAKAHTIEELRCQIQRDVKVSSKDEAANALHILAVMVPGGPYANDRETRLRHRYALVSGLISAGYKPRDSEHIGFVDFAGACVKTLSEKQQEDRSNLCRMPPIMPYEWFRLEETPIGRAPQKILVLWLNNDAFGKTPLLKLHNLAKLIEPRNGGNDIEHVLIEHRFQIIGPYDTATYGYLAKEIDFVDKLTNFSTIYWTCLVSKSHYVNCAQYADKRIYDFVQKNLFLSPTATIDIDIKSSYLGYVVVNNTHPIRTITSNNDNMYALNCELILRGVDIFGQEGQQYQQNQFLRNYCGIKAQKTPVVWLGAKKDHYVVLIGEQDTRYSRKLTESFVKSMDDLKDKDIHIAQDRIREFSYLRGIDVLKDSTVKVNDDEPRKDDRKSGDPGATKNIAGIHRPEDAYQFDYVRRLAERLERLQQELSRREAKGAIKAIGILGSDPYDKLLILQALHKKFPQVIFFTTDLDARFLHPEQALWTRNLIVASSYGLELHDDLQRGVPPFRDNYQTALYLTTQFAALCRKESNEIACENPSGWNKDRSLQEIFDSINTKFNPQETSSRASPSRLFEIGNREAVDISFASFDNGIHPETMPDLIQQPLHFVYLIFFLLVLAYFLTGLVSKKEKVPQIIVGITAGLFFVAWVFILLRLSGNGWMYFIYLIIFLGMLAFFLSYLLQGTSRKIVLCIIGGFAAIAVIYILCRLTAIPSLDTFSFSDGVSTWPANAIRSFAIVLAVGFCMTIYAQLRGYQPKIEKDFGFERVAGDEKTPRYLERRVIADTPRPKFYIDNWGDRPDNEPVQEITNLWHGLYQMMGWKQHAIRVSAMLLLYSACVSLLYFARIIEIPEFPARGQIDFAVTPAVFLFVVFAYLVLIFVIADIAHLASRLIRLLKKNNYSWPSATLGAYCDRYGSTELARQKLKIDLIHRIALKTNEFIYYPLVILFLLILSRSHFFDNWHYTPFLFFVFCFTAILALLSAARLRCAAIDARDKVLEAVQDRYWLLQSQNDAHKKCARLLIDEIKSMDNGPFLPLSKHPVFLSVLLPLSSIGGLYLIEYMMTAS